MKRSLTQLLRANLWTSKLLILSISLLLCSCSKKDSLDLKNQKGFKFNLPREIHSLDPLLNRGSAKNYIAFNLHRGLFYYDQNNQLKKHGAQNCQWEKDLNYICSLKKLKWSDGSPITAKDYEKTFNVIKSLKEESTIEISEISKLKVLSDYKIKFTLKTKNKSFPHSLASLNWTPRHKETTFLSPSKQKFSGPYKLKHITKSYIHLTNNKNFNDHTRPDAIGVFVDEPSAALRMYENNYLDFLRYLETAYIKKYSDQILLSPIAKLDGLFIRKSFLPKKTREKLFKTLDFKELQNIFQSKGTPGCTPVLKSFFKTQKIPCIQQDPDVERLKLETVLNLKIPKHPYNDLVRFAEWLKASWEKKHDLKVNIDQMDAKVFYASLKEHKLKIYRKSLPLSNLSCEYAKKELLRQPEFKDIKINTNLDCSDFFTQAIKEFTWLPMGTVHFYHLHSKKFKGYYLNALDQFGLENLQERN